MDISPGELAAQAQRALGSWPWIPSVEDAHGLPRWLLVAIASRETNCTNEPGDAAPRQTDPPNWPGKPYHAWSPWQIDRNSGGSPDLLSDPRRAADIAAGMLTAHRARFPGDLKAAASAYNAGEGGAAQGLAQGDSDRFTTGHDYGCVDEATEILTDVGWISHDRLVPGTTVYTINRETGLAEWQTVVSVQRYPGQHQLFRLRTPESSIMVTANHRWPVFGSGGRVGLRETRALRRRDRIPRIAPCADLPTAAKYEDAFVELVAWFWTEGSIAWKGTKVTRVTISQSREVNQRNVDRIRDCLTRLFGPGSEGPLTRNENRCFRGHPLTESSVLGRSWGHPTCRSCEALRRGGGATPIRKEPRWRETVGHHGRNAIFSLNVAAYRPLLDVAPERIVSLDFVRQLTAAQLLLFIQASVDGDGSRTQAGGFNLRQAARARAESFQIAALLAGYPTSLSLHEDGTWGVCAGVTPHFFPCVRPDRWEVIDYAGIVWCPTTPNQTWLARRDGIPYFTGNSDVLGRLAWLQSNLTAPAAPSPQQDEEDAMAIAKSPTDEARGWTRFLFEVATNDEPSPDQLNTVAATGVQNGFEALVTAVLDSPQAQKRRAARDAAQGG